MAAAMQKDEPYYKDIAISLRVLSLNEQSVKLITEIRTLQVHLDATIDEMKRQVEDAPSSRDESSLGRATVPV